jgi:hypothetical protein
MGIAEPVRVQASVVRDMRRVRNARRSHQLADELLCECGRISCDATLPATAETHRGPGEFIVTPRHVDVDRALVIDDRFVIVTTKRY